MRRGIDLRLREIALCRQLRGIEFNNRLAFFQPIAFAMKNLLHPAAHPRRHVHFIDFDRAGNGIRFAAAAEKEKRRGAEEERPVLQGAQKLINLASEVERYGGIFRHAARAQARDSA